MAEARSLALMMRELEAATLTQKTTTSAFEPSLPMQTELCASAEEEVQVLPGNDSGAEAVALSRSPDASPTAQLALQASQQEAQGSSQADQSTSVEQAGSHTPSDESTESKDETFLDFLPDRVPECPTEMNEPTEDGHLRLNKLSNELWHVRGRAVREYYNIPWSGAWELVPAKHQKYPENPVNFALKLSSLGVVGQGSFGRVAYQERWVGQGPPGSPQPDGSSGFIPVAVKETTNDQDSRQEVRALRVVQEKLAGASGPHHIASLIEVSAGGESDKIINMVTKYEDGFTLNHVFTWLRDCVEDGSDSGAEAQLLACAGQTIVQMLQGLSVLHSCGLAHCDIKGDNGMPVLPNSGNPLHAVVIDLGNTTDFGENCSTVDGALDYIAPEVMKSYDDPEVGAQHLVGGAIDIWSLGCTLYELLTGEHLFAYEDGEDELDAILKLHAGWAQCYAIGELPPTLLNLLPASLQEQQHVGWQNAVNLLQHMLHPDPAGRWNARQISAHEFCRQQPHDIDS